MPSIPLITHLNRITTERTENLIFRGVSKYSWANACVGENGQPDTYYYAQGYLEAAIILSDKVISERFLVDTLIYPICFNFRHSIELYLKAFLDEVNVLSKIKKVNLESEVANHHLDNKVRDVKGMHDIELIWNDLVIKTKIIDKRYAEFTEKLSPLIACISEVDPTGQTFRYNYDMESKQKHLVKVSVINVINLRYHFSLIKKILDDLIKLNSYLLEEYSTGTFTKNLSRHDISLIAEKLPPREEWGGDFFNAIKDEIRQQFKISNREFSSALNLIQSSHDLCIKVDMTATIPLISYHTLIEMLDLWNELYSMEKLKVILSRKKESGIVIFKAHKDEDYDITESLERQAKERKAFLNFATPDTLAIIMAFQEAAMNLFSENFTICCQSEHEKMQYIYETSPEQWEQEVYLTLDEIFCSLNFPVRVVKSLRDLNLNSIADDVLTRYQFHGLI